MCYITPYGGTSKCDKALHGGEGGQKRSKKALHNLWTAPYYTPECFPNSKHKCVLFGQNVYIRSADTAGFNFHPYEHCHEKNKQEQNVKIKKIRSVKMSKSVM